MIQAFVQVLINGDFSNENHYLAYRGFNYFDYDTVLFKSNEINKINITKDTPVYTGVDCFANCLKKLKIDIKDRELSSYPVSIEKYLDRKYGIYSLSEIKKMVDPDKPFFVKPLDADRKAFNGFICKDNQSLEFLKNIPDFYQCYVFETVDILSEYRVFIHKNKILDSRKYQGDFRYNLDYNIVGKAIADLTNPPVAYCLDFGFTKDGKTILIEGTDAWSFAPYGLDMIHFTNMIVDRWKEITYE